MSQSLSPLELFELQKKIQQSRLDLENNKKTDLHHIFEFIQQVELLNSGVRTLRNTPNVDQRLLEQSEDVLSFTAHNVFSTLRSQYDEKELGVTDQYRLVWRKNFSLFLFTVALFVISMGVGYAMTVAKPDYSSLFIGQGTIENIMDKEAWFERIRENPIMYGFEIAFNNIRVAVMAFVLGAIAGIGGIYILVFNGLMVGSIVAFCQIYNFDEALLAFITGHGPLELTLIIAGTFASFIFGRSFYHLPYSTLGQRIKKNAKEAILVIYGVSIWLCVAAAIEVGVSPWEYLNPNQKLALGGLMTALFFYWTFRPVSSSRKRVL